MKGAWLTKKQMKDKANNFCFRIQGYVGGCFSLQTINVKNNEMLRRT